jgi:hypothetical protein
MAIWIRCPSGHYLYIDDHLAGRKIRCGGCGKIMYAPGTKQTVRKTPLPPFATPVPATSVSPSSPPPKASPRPPFHLSGAAAQIALPPRRTPAPKVVARPAAAPQPQDKARLAAVMEAARETARSWLQLRPRTMPAGVCRAEPARCVTLYKLAGLLALAVVLSLVPVVWLGHLNVETAPGWARAALVLAGLQILFLGRMLSAPDWASAWIVMLVFAFTAVVYAVVLAMTMVTPVDHQLALGLGPVRYGAAGWCGGVLAVMALATYLAGRVSVRWRRGLR